MGSQLSWSSTSLVFKRSGVQFKHLGKWEVVGTHIIPALGRRRQDGKFRRVEAQSPKKQTKSN